PALDLAALQERARVGETRGNRLDGAVEPGDRDRRRAQGPVPVTELTVLIVAPTLDAAVGQERARVTGSRRDGLNAAPHRGHRDRSGSIGDRAVAELPELVVSPALDGAALEGTCVEGAAGQLVDAVSKAGDGDRREATGRRPVAELPVAVVSP